MIALIDRLHAATCERLESLSSWGSASGRDWICSVADTLRCTLQDGRPTLVSRSAQDWRYLWPGGRLYYPTPTSDPRSLIEDNWDIFTFLYTPGPGDVVFDVGAGVGTEAQRLSNAVGPTGTVVAVEADPDCARRLRKLVDGARLTNVTVVEAAIGASSGTARLALTGVDGATNSMVGTAPADRYANVPQITLGELFEKFGCTRIDYLKMNIEGAEREALQGWEGQASVVRHWCVSCHDFLGTPETATQDFVQQWFEERGFSPRVFPASDSRPWANHYIFVDTDRPS